MRVARERHTIHFIDALGDSRASMQARFDLCIDSRRGKRKSEDNEGEGPQFANHGPLSYSRICPEQIAERGTPGNKERGRTLVRSQVDGRASMPANSGRDTLLPSGPTTGRDHM